VKPLQSVVLWALALVDLFMSAAFVDSAYVHLVTPFPSTAEPDTRRNVGFIT
jgi:hypothetical protein